MVAEGPSNLPSTAKVTAVGIAVIAVAAMDAMAIRITVVDMVTALAAKQVMPSKVSFCGFLWGICLL